jgi:hypothetical protein
LTWNSGTAMPLLVVMVSEGSRSGSRRSCGTARAITSMCSIPSRYCVTVTGEQRLQHLRHPAGEAERAGTVLIASETYRLDLLVQLRCGSIFCCCPP